MPLFDTSSLIGVARVQLCNKKLQLTYNICSSIVLLPAALYSPICQFELPTVSVLPPLLEVLAFPCAGDFGLLS